MQFGCQWDNFKDLLLNSVGHVRTRRGNDREPVDCEQNLSMCLRCTEEGFLIMVRCCQGIDKALQNTLKIIQLDESKKQKSALFLLLKFCAVNVQPLI